MARYEVRLLQVNCEVKSESEKWKVKVKSESDDKKVLRFSWNLYVLYIMYIPITKTEEKCAGQLSYVFNIQEKLEGCTNEKKFLERMIFQQ